MALAIEGVATATGSGSGPFTWSHTCSSTDRFLLIGVSYYTAAATISALTYNGVALTVVPSSTVTIGQYTSTLYSLIAPDSGSNTVSITFTATVYDFGAGAIAFSGAHQTTPLGTAATASNTSTTPSVNVTAASGELVIDTLTIVHTGTLTVGADQTQRWNGVSSIGHIKYASSSEDGVATTTMSWSNSTSQAWALSSVAVKPVASAAAGVRQLCLTGVGT